jgi:hypothetical protein
MKKKSIDYMKKNDMNSVTKWDVLYKSGVYVLKALCLTPTALYGV